ncbi:class I SAM-dependent methyltransferase [Streptomyces cylindrosporus]|uniref:Class I SAM-dependent methyltransferase n=1 Tax=Streptomyces cylindrosporus TaxID=2927583 RepID=A0ABS9YC57_9ACTN|nr:class I SAM-dependent methyltransferase [Streptomyces cylindrosporus]MCI3274793.1 class I SAM-dependent methyltransferase [Streptomyces cylindrosporus]
MTLEPSYLSAVRQSYDTVAADYVEQVPRPAALDPLSRGMLGVFAEIVRETDLGPVADLGCGPGFVTAHLAALGVPVSGVDLSPRMVELARHNHPELSFSVGSMTALDIADDSLGGILAYYSTHHTPPEVLPLIYTEFHRTLKAGGTLMLAGYVGDGERLRPTQGYGGHPVSYESHLQPVERLVELMEAAGLIVTTRVVQEPGKTSKRRIATLLAEKPVG